MKTEYYEELAGYGDPAILAGWRNRLEQALRFEVALRAAPGLGPGASVLDVGCGPGGLWSYLRDTGRALEYRGVDWYERSVLAARSRFGGGRFEHVDVYDAALDAERFDLVVAVGTLITGESVTDEVWRRERFERLTRRIFELSSGSACLIVLNQKVVEERASLQMDEALAGAHVAELEELAASTTDHWEIRDDFLSTDLALYLHREGRERGSEATSVHEAVLAGPWGQEADAVEHAWLWVEAGEFDRARELLSGPQAPVGGMADLLRERLGI